MVGLRDVLVVAPAATFHPPHHHHHHHHHESTMLSSGEHSIIPPGIHLWQAQPSSSAQQHHQQQQQIQNPNPNPNLSYLKKPVPMLDASGILGGGGYATCQDCGNQAKKDCTHRRCRTCCKSRGFDCSTHVKSTWVPAARRRERQQFSVPGTVAGSSATSTSAPKKPRLISSQTTTTTSTSNTTPRSNDTSSSHQDAGFRESLPGHVRAPAVFKCVRVTSMEDGEDEYAYQAMVRIGGHMFKGFLYDQGVDTGRGLAEDHTHITTDSNAAIPNMSELNLGGASSSGAGAGPSHSYGGTGGFLGGTHYGNPIN